MGDLVTVMLIVTVVFVPVFAIAPDCERLENRRTIVCRRYIWRLGLNHLKPIHSGIHGFQRVI